MKMRAGDGTSREFYNLPSIQLPIGTTERMNILQYESKIWATADLLRGSGIKESEWPSFMMPFFALAMIESRLIRMFDELKAEIGEEAFGEIEHEDLVELIK
ncbi:hypothetical protein VU02_04920, partial [Desulfobulbus sp. N2]|nr:hypothetical protein [Desulfobulbus sp. N2]